MRNARRRRRRDVSHKTSKKMSWHFLCFLSYKIAFFFSKRKFKTQTSRTTPSPQTLCSLYLSNLSCCHTSTHEHRLLFARELYYSADIHDLSVLPPPSVVFLAFSLVPRRKKKSSSSRSRRCLRQKKKSKRGVWAKTCGDGVDLTLPLQVKQPLHLPPREQRVQAARRVSARLRHVAGAPPEVSLDVAAQS